MKELSLKEHKKRMLEMLAEFNNYCIKNDIKYTLIGGSLIGAIRNNGIIPWDDDIDIILMPEEYKKLEKSIKNEPFSFRIIGYNNFEDYYNPAFKIIDDRTYVIEDGIEKKYGAFIDIFRYNYVPDNFFFKKVYYLKYKYMLNVIHGFSPAAKNTKSLIKKLRNVYSSKLNREKYLNRFYSFLNKHNKKKTKSVIPNSLMYPFDKELQNSAYLKEYKLITFDGVEAMISTNYDQILKKVFGDYMTPPPKEKRVGKHSLKVIEK